MIIFENDHIKVEIENTENPQDLEFCKVSITPKAPWDSDYKHINGTMECFLVPEEE